MISMAVFSLPSPRMTMLEDWAKFTNSEPRNTTFKYLFASTRISPLAPESASRGLVKIRPTAMITADKMKTSAIRLPMILSTVSWSLLPMALERMEAEPVPISVATPLFRSVKG